ncbi:hypothetical protein ACQJBY_037089 [Aegilops geniculata]
MYPLPPLDVVRDGHRHGNVATEIPHSNPRLRGDWRSASDRAQNPVQCQWWVVLQCEGWWRFEEETGACLCQLVFVLLLFTFRINRDSMVSHYQPNYGEFCSRQQIRKQQTPSLWCSSSGYC